MSGIERYVRTITFEPDGSIAVEFITPSVDIRQNGLQMQHALLIPADSDYEDELEALREAVQFALEDALEDFLTVPAVDLIDDDDDDEEDDE